MSPETALEDAREIRSRELVLLEKLLSQEFMGAQSLRRQLSCILVSTLDSDGSLRITVNNTEAPRSAVSCRVPVEASYIDLDGVEAHILLHVIDGNLDELEIYREDSKPTKLSAFDAEGLRFEVSCV